MLGKHYRAHTQPQPHLRAQGNFKLFTLTLNLNNGEFITMVPGETKLYHRVSLEWAKFVLGNR